MHSIQHVLMPQLAEADLHSMTVQYMAELLSLAVDTGQMGHCPQVTDVF